MRAMVLLVVTGCAGGVSLDLLSSALVDARCEQLVRCGEFASKRECNARLREANDPTPTALVDQGRLEYDGDAADECLATIAHATCNVTAYASRVPSDACRRMFTGTVGGGGSCTFDGECLSQHCDRQPDCIQSCCLGTCTNPPAEPGATCYDNECVDGEFCDRSQGLATCRPLLPLGDACTDGSQCEYGLGCAGGTCKVLPREGYACPDGVCARIGLVCGTSGTCMPAGVLGDACAGRRDCSPYYTCDGSRCVPPPIVGEPCADDGCSDDSYCDIEQGGPTGVCTARKEKDAPCQASFECASRWCTGTCSEPMACR